MNLSRTFLMVFISTLVCGISSGFGNPPLLGKHSQAQFQQYWYPKGAEISRFSLKQVRYGEIHAGDAVMVFVTEKMNPEIQVKAENPGPRDIPILKLNATRKFFTGIYPYSIMTSTFAPVDVRTYPLPLKISSSTQEWCGNVYLQMNLQDGEYRIQGHSYFEAEGDIDLRVKNDLPEDAIWTTIRIAPGSLPQGEFLLLPGATFTRMQHRPIAPLRVFAKLEAGDGRSLEGNSLVGYEMRFPDVNRTLIIRFERIFPYRIQSWEDTIHVSGQSDKRQQVLTTAAIRTHTIMIDYWNYNRKKDRKLLKKLGINSRSMQ